MAWTEKHRRNHRAAIERLWADPKHRAAMVRRQRAAAAERNGVAYPWDEWFKRRLFHLAAGVDYDCTTSSMSGQIRRAASERRLSVSVKERTVLSHRTGRLETRLYVEVKRRKAVRR